MTVCMEGKCLYPVIFKLLVTAFFLFNAVDAPEQTRDRKDGCGQKLAIFVYDACFPPPCSPPFPSFSVTMLNYILRKCYPLTKIFSYLEKQSVFLENKFSVHCLHLQFPKLFESCYFPFFLGFSHFFCSCPFCLT